nr:alpha/beta hydrolase [uncultured Sandarakinorhabdus sp.]
MHIIEALPAAPLAGQPALVLLHQSPLSGAMFLPAMPLLAAAGLRVLALDTPGFGASDPPPAPPSIADHADALADVLDALELPCAHVLGHHTGASIAAALAARHGHRVERLVLNGLALLSPEEGAHFASFRFAPLQPRADGGHLVDAWHQRLRATPGWTDIDAMHRHVVTMLANPERYFWAFEAVFGHDLAADLAVITVPTLVLTNSGEDIYDATCRAAQSRPDWAFTALNGGTHDIVDEQPQAWADAVTQFLLPR